MEKRAKYAKLHPEMSNLDLTKILSKKYKELPEKKKVGGGGPKWLGGKRLGAAGVWVSCWVWGGRERAGGLRQRDLVSGMWEGQQSRVGSWAAAPDHPLPGPHTINYRHCHGVAQAELGAGTSHNPQCSFTQQLFTL